MDEDYRPLIVVPLAAGHAPERAVFSMRPAREMANARRRAGELAELTGEAVHIMRFRYIGGRTIEVVEPLADD